MIERDWTFLIRRFNRVLFFSTVISFAEQELAQIMACSSRNILVAFMFELLWLDWRMLNRCECSRQFVRWCSYLGDCERGQFELALGVSHFREEAPV